ncbi:MAG: hypothetical protein FVQ83_07375 [Chloroflexi bacterium]|nr:hypothetical protein [Chloroflexota bacterium]
MPIDNDKNNETPVEGKGDEMLPVRGLPFDDDLEINETVTDVLDAYTENEEPRDFSADELATIVGELEDTSPVTLPIEEDYLPDGGMSAIHPIISDEDLDETPGIPTEDIEPPAEDSARGMPAFDDRDWRKPGVTSGIAGTEERGASANLDSAEDLLNLFVTKERLDELWKRMDQARIDIREKVPSLPIARQLYDQIERSRNELLAGRKYYEEAERSINEVELRIAAAERAQAENRSANKILLYEVLWGIGLIAAYIWLAPYIRDLTLVAIGPEALLSFPTLASDLLTLSKSAVTAGLGGIVGALYALWKHVSRDLDFSKQFAMWYITNPIMGMFLGIFVFLVMRVGLLSLTLGSGSQEVSSPFAIYVLAFIVGFQQNVAYGLMRRVLKVFQIPENDGERDGLE